MRGRPPIVTGMIDPVSGIYPVRGVISSLTCATLHISALTLTELSLNSTMSEPKPENSSHQPPTLVSTPAASSNETKPTDATVTEPVAQPEQPPPPPTHPVEDRLSLLSRARVFLASPQVQHQNIPAKRAFLAEKGLNETEIDNLLREVVSAFTSSNIVVPLILVCIRSPFLPPVSLHERIRNRLHLISLYFCWVSSICSHG